MKGLAICIPTFNRARFIGATLESIVSQITDGVEIIVSDNASADETEKVVASFRERIPRLTYFRWPENMGADRNFLKVVELAASDYCWFMGSDDIVEQGAIEAILRAIRENDLLTGMSLNRVAYTADLSKRSPAPRPVAGRPIEGDLMLTSFEDAMGLLCEYFGYISGQLVNRARWQEVISRCELEPFFNAYVHVYVIGKMIQAHPRWLYLATPCVGYRSGNDSFLSEGALRRLELDVVGYDKIACALFPKQPRLYRKWINTAATVHVRFHVGNAKAAGMPAGFFWKVFKLCVRHYWSYPGFWVLTFPRLIMPAFVFKSLRAAYRAFKGRSR